MHWAAPMPILFKLRSSFHIHLIRFCNIFSMKVYEIRSLDHAIVRISNKLYSTQILNNHYPLKRTEHELLCIWFIYRENNNLKTGKVTYLDMEFS